MEVYKTLMPGDPWTFLDEQSIAASTDGRAKVGTRVDKWFSTGERGRLFEIVAVHPGKGFETRYLGFQHLPGWFFTDDEVAAQGGAEAMIAKQEGDK